MKVEHTAEPWFVVAAPWGNGTWINAGTDDPHGGQFVADCLDAEQDGDEQAQHNARRAVACVNGCAGFETELLEKVVALGTTLGQRLAVMGGWAEEEAEKQRDELAEAIRLTLDENGHLADGDVCTLKRLKDALAKVGAGSTAIEGHNAPHEGRELASVPLDAVVGGRDAK